MIYTSYFAQIKNLPDNIVPISICAKAPAWYNGLQYKKLAPTYDILMSYKKDLDKESYTKRFSDEILKQYDVEQIIDDLILICHENDFYGKSVCLLCYEKPTDFCHRHLVANWFAENGFECKEWHKE